jgi:EmrB/QacA subfamily drug resistance transporter
VTTGGQQTGAGIRADSPAGRWVLTAAVLGSGMALLDGSVVNVALRRVGTDLDASVQQLQWVVNAYLLSLAALILIGGALGDRFGRRRIFTLGVVWFGAASALCGLATTADQLVLARLVQGVGAALLTPGSLALIQASFVAQDRGRVIGRWAGLGGIAAAVGPPLGGWVVDVASWRWVFWVNLPLAAVIVWVTQRHVPESCDAQSPREFDVPGAVLAVVGLGTLTWGLIQTASRFAVPALVVGLLALAGFVAWERRARNPMVPLHLFSSRVFGAANAMTLLVYAALGALTFFLVLQLQVSVGYSPLMAGLATLPITIALLLLSGRAGALATRIGPRPLMAVGPVACGAGTFLLSGVDEASSYWTDVLPGLTVFSLGLSALVAPLTTSVLAAAPDRFAGTASGINNAVARTGSLLAVAALPALVGLTGVDYEVPEVFTAGYAEAMRWCTGLLVAGGVVSWFGLGGREVAAEVVSDEPTA